MYNQDQELNGTMLRGSMTGVNRRRVLLIAPQPFYACRGTPINVRAMAQSLAELDYDVDLLVLPVGESITMPGVRILRCPSLPLVNAVPIGPSWRKIAFDGLLLMHALFLTLKNRYDVVHGVEEGGFIAWAITRISRTPFIFDLDSFIPEQLSSRGFIKNQTVLNLIERFESYCLRRATAVLTVCEALTEKVRRLAPETPAVTIEDCPTDSAVEVDELLVSRTREKHGLQGKRVIVYTGNFAPYQGITLLLQALHELTKQEPDAAENTALLLVGGGSSCTEGLAEARALCRSLGIESLVHFVGERPEKEMGSFLALADVLVSPRLEGENTPLKIYSYMAAHRPIVATRIHSHCQVLTDDNSFLAEPNPSAFAGALRAALAETPEARSEQRRRAHSASELVERKFSRAEFKRRLAALYATVIARQLYKKRSSGDLERAPESIMLRDISGEITAWNAQSQQLYGWDHSEAVGRVSHALLQTTFPGPLNEINEQLLQTAVWTGELEHRRRDGRSVRVQSTWALQRDSLGKPAFVVEINRVTRNFGHTEQPLESSGFVAGCKRLVVGLFTVPSLEALL